MTACGVNFVDALFVQGEYQIKPPLPFIPGSELAGVVSEVGSAVTTVSVGDVVSANVGLGGYVSEAVVGADQVVVVGDAMDPAVAATFGQSYGTAWFALTRRVVVAAGDTVVVLGAAGGVGQACIDVARHLGARVIAVASTPEKRTAALGHGAHDVVDPSIERFSATVRDMCGGGADVVVDPVGGPLSVDALRTLAVNGSFMVIGFASGEIPALPANQILLRNRQVVGVDWGMWALENPAENAAMTAEIVGHISAGNLTPTAPESVPLGDVVVALTRLVARDVIGKMALVP